MEPGTEVWYVASICKELHSAISYLAHVSIALGFSGIFRAFSQEKAASKIGFVYVCQGGNESI